MVVFFIFMSRESFGFRQANPHELAELTIVMERANAGRDGNPLPTSMEGKSEAIEAMRARMNKIAAETYVATLGEKIVGFSMSHPLIDPEHTDSDGDTQHLSLLMVDPDYWGERIASKLMDITVEHARNSGKRQLTLWTRKADNSRAQAVYGHKGFILTGVERLSEHGEQVQYQLGL